METIVRIIFLAIIAVDCWLWGYSYGKNKALKLLVKYHFDKLKKSLEQKGLSEEEIKQHIKDFIEADPYE